MINNAEIYRIIANLFHVGTVEEIQIDPPRVRVQTGEHLSYWLPWLTQRAGQTKTWNPPTIGEQVLLLCPMGELSQAIVLPALNSTANPVPQQTLDTTYTSYPDGTTTTYDHVKHALTLDIKGDVYLKTTGKVSADISSDLEATVGGKLTADIKGTAAVKAGGATTVDAPSIALNAGAGVVTGAHICPFTGSPHSDFSSTVTAGK